MKSKTLSEVSFQDTYGEGYNLLFNRYLADLNINKPQSDNDNRSSLNQQPTVGEERSWRTTKQPIILPEWMVKSSIVIFLLGIFMVVAASCYCCIFGQRHRTKYVESYFNLIHILCNLKITNLSFFV